MNKKLKFKVVVGGLVFLSLTSVASVAYGGVFSDWLQLRRGGGSSFYPASVPANAGYAGFLSSRPSSARVPPLPVYFPSASPSSYSGMSSNERRMLTIRAVEGTAGKFTLHQTRNEGSGLLASGKVSDDESFSYPPPPPRTKVVVVIPYAIGIRVVRNGVVVSCENVSNPPQECKVPVGRDTQVLIDFAPTETVIVQFPGSGEGSVVVRQGDIDKTCPSSSGDCQVNNLFLYNNITLIAEPVGRGNSFDGWFDDSGTLLSSAISYQLRLNGTPNPTTITAVFKKDETLVISGIEARDITHNSAVISWQTNKPADGAVEYKVITGANPTIIPPFGGSLGTEHSRRLTGLESNTLYTYRVESSDVAGNSAVSEWLDFRTLKAPAPNISVSGGRGKLLDGNVAMGARVDLNQYLDIRADSNNTESTEIISFDIEEKDAGLIAFKDLGVFDESGRPITGTFQLMLSRGVPVAYVKLAGGALVIPAGERQRLSLKASVKKDYDGTLGTLGTGHAFRFNSVSGAGLDSKIPAVVANTSEYGPTLTIVKTLPVLGSGPLGAVSGRSRAAVDDIARPTFYTTPFGSGTPEAKVENLTLTFRGSALKGVSSFPVSLIDEAGNNWGDSTPTDCSPVQEYCKVTLPLNVFAPLEPSNVKGKLRIDSSGFANDVGTDWMSVSIDRIRTTYDGGTAWPKNVHVFDAQYE